jgi:thioredoxin reductase (NADPH)
MKKQPEHIYEIAVVGAGPIGIELAVTLKRMGVDYIQFDAKQMGHTISWWPRNTNFFSTTERVEIAGVPIANMTQQRTTGEEYLVYLRSIVEQFNLQINSYEPITNIQRTEGHFKLTSAPATGGEQIYFARNVVLAKGDMDNPNLLNIPGEDLPHVSHYFEDVHPYFQKRLLIVGGRNSAAEAALRCWRAGAKVSMSYRGETFDRTRIKHWIMPDLDAQIELGNIQFIPNTQPIEITKKHVVLKNWQTDQEIQHETDFVLLLTGFVQNMALFKKSGIKLLGDYLIPEYNQETMETNVPGIYLAGTSAAGRRQPRYRIFIENAHEHVGKIVQAITGEWPKQLGDEDGIRFGFFRTLEELQTLAIELESQRPAPLSEAQKILGQYQSAYFDLKAVLLGIDEAKGSQPPAEGEWSAKNTLIHMLRAEMRFYTVVKFAINKIRAGETPTAQPSDEDVDVIAHTTEEEWDSFSEWSLEKLKARFEQVHAMVLGELADISDAELAKPSFFWEDQPYSLRFRLHRFTSHLRQHTVQIEKTLIAIDQAPSEAKQLHRHIYNAFAEVQNAQIGLDKVNGAAQKSLAETINARATEFAKMITK